MEEIAHSTVQDRYKLFQSKGANGKVSERGFMITVNPSSDLTAVSVCDAVVEYARGMRCNTLLAIETFQFRGEKRKKKRTRICRPHAHLVVDVPLEEAAAIAAFFSTGGSNVEINPVRGAEGLCEYLSKDPKGYFYMREAHDGLSTANSATVIERSVVYKAKLKRRQVKVEVKRRQVKVKAKLKRRRIRVKAKAKFNRYHAATLTAPPKAGRAWRFGAIWIPWGAFNGVGLVCFVSGGTGWSMTRAP